MAEYRSTDGLGGYIIPEELVPILERDILASGCRRWNEPVRISHSWMADAVVDVGAILRDDVVRSLGEAPIVPDFGDPPTFMGRPVVMTFGGWSSTDPTLSPFVTLEHDPQPDAIVEG